MPERTGAGIVHHLAQVVVVVFQRLLAHDDVPATGKRPQHKIAAAGFAELEFNGVVIAHVDLAHRREQGRARTAKARAVAR